MHSSNPIFSMKPQTQRKQSQKNLFKIAFNPNPSLSIAFNPSPSLSLSLSISLSLPCSGLLQAQKLKTHLLRT